MVVHNRHTFWCLKFDCTSALNHIRVKKKKRSYCKLNKFFILFRIQNKIFISKLTLVRAKFLN